MKTNNSLRQPAEADVAGELTRSEIKCLALVAEGMNANAIGEQLSLASTEIEVLLFCAQRKLGADNLLQAVSVAMSKGMITV